MPIDFSLSPEQHAVRQRARDLAREVLTAAREATHHLATPEERFVASRPHYRALVQAGLLRRLIPPPLGGEMTSLVDLAIEAEELMAVETSVPLSVFSTGLGLMPLLFFGTGEQQSRLLTPFLSGDDEPLASLAFSETGGTANFRQSGPDVGIQTVARRDGDEWVITGRKKWTPHASGWDGKGADLTPHTLFAEDRLTSLSRDEPALRDAQILASFSWIRSAARAMSVAAPRELRHSFVSLMSSTGVPVEEIARLAGHASSRTTEVVYRRELRPVLTTGAEATDRLFKVATSQ